MSSFFHSGYYGKNNNTKKLPEKKALEMAYKAIDQGAAGVDMGRNIFQSDCPIGMIKAVTAVVHRGEKPKQAIQIYKETKALTGT